MKLKKFWLALHISISLYLSLSLSVPPSPLDSLSLSLPSSLPLILCFLVRLWQKSVKGNDLKPIIGFRCTLHSFFPLCDKVISAARYTCSAAAKRSAHFISLLCAVQLRKKTEMLRCNNCSQAIILQLSKDYLTLYLKLYHEAFPDCVN